MTTPYQPAFNAVALASNSQSSSWQKVIYNQSVQQTGGTNYSSTNSRFTAPVAGWYQFNCSWTASNNADVDGTIGFQLKITLEVELMELFLSLILVVAMMVIRFHLLYI